jgi:hypothetical protein
LFAAVEQMLERPSLSEAALRRQHEIVVALHVVADALLPARFGALVGREELNTVVRLRRSVLARALDRVRGREQMTIRIFGRPESSSRKTAASSGAAYLRQRAASVSPRLTGPAKRIAAGVAPLCTAQSVDAGRGEVQVTVHHLIRRGDAANYKRLVRSQAAALTPSPELAVSGPWPPFAFAPDIWSTDVEPGRRAKQGGRA